MAEGLPRDLFGDAVRVRSAGSSDPGGNLIEIHARLDETELAEMPDDKEAVCLVGGA